MWGGSGMARSTGSEDTGKPSVRSHNMRRLLFRGAPVNMAQPELRDYFADYGAVRSLILFSDADHQPQGKGVCMYEAADSARQAASGGIIVEGRTLVVRRDRARRVDEVDRGKGSGSGSIHLASLHRRPRRRRRTDSDESQQAGVAVDPARTVYFCSTSFEGAVPQGSLGVRRDVTETFMRKLFEEAAGPLRRFELWRNDKGKSRGQGIVEFIDVESVRRAQELNGKEVKRRRLHVCSYDPSKRRSGP
mmetsp:Transcript_80935/g.210933  ORF Transcript_80935/g.210933 Transcript_80935/m.210933 type:complete len:248 (+) Transcript_80935:340-1083(+)